MPLPNPLVTIEPDLMSGQPTFTGTRVPVKTLSDYLAENQPLSEFLADFPGVSSEHAIAVLDLAFDTAFPPVQERKVEAAE